MSNNESMESVKSETPRWYLVLAGIVLLWLSQPPLGWGLLAWVAMIPWIAFARSSRLTRRDYVSFYFLASLYYGLTMQGIRHAHPAMYATLLLFAIYLAMYAVLFVVLVRAAARERRVVLPLWLSVPCIGTGLECLRNYLLTGVSAVMLGHTQAEYSWIIQIAAAFGSYGVTFVVLAVNALLYQAWTQRRCGQQRWWYGLLGAAGVLAAVAGYGLWRLAKPAVAVESGSTTLALIGRDEDIVFEQDAERELEIFDAYVQQSLAAAVAAAKDQRAIDAFVWPESMYTGGLPWLLLQSPKPQAGPLSSTSVPIIEENRKQFQARSRQVQQALQRTTGQAESPHLIAGCSIVYFGEPPQVFSGIVHVGERGQVVDWYGKTHLVMFGEYIPLIRYLPFIQSLVPPGMGVEQGVGPVLMKVGELAVSPSICIETAVERVCLNQVVELEKRGQSPDLIVNVTNDGWFDRSSVVEHHLRCSQFVAIACGRPVLIAANGGPTAWIDSTGAVVQRLRHDEAGFILANVTKDARWGLYQAIGDWPARLLAAYCLWLLVRRLWAVAKRRAVVA